MSKMPEIRLQSTRAGLLVCVIAVLQLASCAAPRPAPVSDARPPVAKADAAVPAAPAADSAKPAEALRVHIVQRGETLYSIAFQNGIDIRELAAWNNIVNPAVIRVGDTIRLTSPDAPAAATPAVPQPGMAVATPLVLAPAVAPGPVGTSTANAPLQASPSTAPAMPAVATENTATMKVEPKAGRVPYSDAAYAKMTADAASAAAGNVIPTVPTTSATTPASTAVVPVVASTAGSDAIAWSWPVKGKLLSTFTDLSKGIDIAGSKGTPVFAAAPGKVIHSGSVIRGYGRLIIIKHSDTWLSAYAHNDKLLVNEGDDVKKGQKIAEMGSSDTDAVKLHFEIRSKGKPVDPMKFLPAQ